jgi:amino acid adenylation domain-containing protein
MHHIVTDVWSVGVLIKEVVALYEAYINQQPAPLPDLKIQYADFASWQRKWLQGPVLNAQLAYWKKQLEGAPRLLSLPADRPRPPVQSLEGAKHSWELSKSLSNNLKSLSRSSGVSLYMFLLAVFKTLLYRYSGQADILVGTPIANRNREEIEPLIGFFVNTLVLRTDLSGNPTFQELLRRVREVSLGAYLHQELPFEKLVEELEPERSLSHHPLFQVMFIFNNAPRPTFHLSGLTMESLDVATEVSKFDLTFIMMETDEGLKGFCHYRKDLFDAVTIERLVNHFNVLLENFAANPAQSLNEAQLLDETERQQLLVEWNDTQSPYSRASSVHQLFEAQAARQPDAVAVAYADEQITYAELNRRANQLAHYLRQLGVGPETLVGILTERSIEWVVGLLAIFKAGGAHLSLDLAYPKERLMYMMEDAGSSLLLTQEGFVDEDIRAKVRVVCLESDRQLIESLSEQNPVHQVLAENAAYIVYTSGSTGRPKGVVNTHGSLLNLITWHQRAFEVTPEDRASQVARMGFDASVWELWPYLTAGASVHLIDEETRLSPDKIRNWLVEKRVTIGWLPPVLAENLLLKENFEGLSLRILLAGSDKLLLPPPDSADFSYINTYGPTEATVIVTSGVVPPQSEKSGAPSIGRPIANTQIYLLDQLLQPVPVSVHGELYLGGDNLARGYLHRPALTAEKFIPHPFSSTPGARLYRTGDVARYLPDGSIEFIGRSDAQVKIHGYRIELGEIESLLAQHAGINAVAVAVQEDAHFGKRLVAYVIPNPARPASSDELRDFLRQHLPGYMLPAVFVTIDALPLSPNGKVDRCALPPADAAQNVSHTDYAPPRTSVEVELIEIWLDLLKLEWVGIHQSFFDAGGHSLLATQLVSRIREKFQVEIPLRALFDSPTIAGLAVEIERSREKTGEINHERIRVIPRGQKSLDELMAELEQLTDAEAQALLNSERQSLR